MIQFNLLPDVKQEYVKARRLKRLVTLASLTVSGAALFVLLLMLVTVDGVQKKSLHDLNNDIKHYSSQLKAIPNIDKILTVQNQLNTLTDLHDKKVVTSRLFGYMSQLTPTTAALNKLSVDFTANTISISGGAPSLDSVNAFTDTLKATKYSTDPTSKTTTKAFSSVVLADFKRDKNAAEFTVTLNFDPPIFDSANNVTLIVPNSTNGAQAALFGNAGS